MAYRHNTGVYDPKFKSNRERRDLEDMLAEWYGAEFAADEITCRTDEPSKLSDLLNGVLEKFVNDRTLRITQLHERFPDMLGTPLNKFAALSSVKENTALVEVRHPAFLQELCKAQVTAGLLAKINAEFPELAISDLQFVPAGQYEKR